MDAKDAAECSREVAGVLAKFADAGGKGDTDRSVRARPDHRCKGHMSELQGCCKSPPAWELTEPGAMSLSCSFLCAGVETTPHPSALGRCCSSVAGNGRILTLPGSFNLRYQC